MIAYVYRLVTSKEGEARGKTCPGNVAICEVAAHRRANEHGTRRKLFGKIVELKSDGELRLVDCTDFIPQQTRNNMKLLQVDCQNDIVAGRFSIFTVEEAEQAVMLL